MTADEYTRLSQRLAALKFLRDATIEPADLRRIDEEQHRVASMLAQHVRWPGAHRDSTDADAAHLAFDQQAFERDLAWRSREGIKNHAAEAAHELERAGLGPNFTPPAWLVELASAPADASAARRAEFEEFERDLHERFSPP